MKSSIIHPSSIRPSFIHPSTHTSIYPAIIYPSSTDSSSSIHPPIHLSIHLPLHHPFIHLLISLSWTYGRKKKSEINQEVIKCNIKIIISLIMFFRVCLLFFVNFNFFYISNIISIKQPVHIGGLTIRQTLNMIWLITNAFNFGGLIDVLNTVNISI